MNWETVIGLEIHAQLATDSKIFSPAPIQYADAPNTQVRETDWGLPGALPVLNGLVVDYAIRLGLAISATINLRSEFARKNYFYPDLPKGYQISQFEYPIIEHGELWINGQDGEQRIGITRAHLEEDAGKLTHDQWPNASGVDLNRAGTPLLEIVSEPDLRNIADAVAYAGEMHKLVRWINICDGNMQEGSFRIDANLSVRRPGAPLGTRCEIKNLNSFRFLEQALTHERARQIALIEDGGVVTQETRLFHPPTGETRPMRGKEDAHDYRYFPDPDLPPLVITDDQIATIRAQMPELPRTRRLRLIDTHHLTPYDATVLTSDRDYSDYYEHLVARAAQLTNTPPATPTHHKLAKLCANWQTGDYAALLNEHKRPITDSPVSAANLAELIAAIAMGTISGKIAKSVLQKMWDMGTGATAIIEKEGLRQIDDPEELRAMARTIITAHPRQAEQYRAGKEKLLGFFVGKLMQATKGKANPEQANTLLKELL